MLYKLQFFKLSRVIKVFFFLLTVYLVIKKRDSFLGFRPLKPVAFHDVIVDLGASFIKLAQVLATRADFLTPEYIDQLKNLHDRVPAMSYEDYTQVWKNAFGETNPFNEIQEQPLASASIGQVHVAYLKNGTKVAVKLRKKGIAQQVSADITIISWFNFVFKPLFSHSTKNSIEAVLAEFSSMIMQEVSFKIELQNLQKFSQVYSDSGVRFPQVFSAYCSDDALVMSFEEGFRFDDKENILKHNIDFKKIITKLVDFYTEQMLVRGYFHADPHPGNLLVTKEGELVLLDFGMVKLVPNAARIAIIELIKAANEQDYELYISASKRLGTIAYEAPSAPLEEFTSKMFDIFSNDNLSSESMQQLAFEVLESTRDLPFKLPSDAIYILRVSAIIEGLGTTYIENFNGIKDILPILQKNLSRALAIAQGPTEVAFDLIKDLPFVVQDFKSSVKKISDGSVSIQINQDQLQWIGQSVRGYARPLILAFTCMASGYLALSLSDAYQVLAMWLFGLGAFIVVYKS